MDSDGADRSDLFTSETEMGVSGVSVLPTEPQRNKNQTLRAKANDYGGKLGEEEARQTELRFNAANYERTPQRGYQSQRAPTTDARLWMI
jgi:hypothetical protein